MASRCLNKVSLIGNLTRDPELRYTPAGVAVCSFGLATNRTWVTQQGEKKEDAQFHRIVAWNKLAELCSQLLAKGRKVFVEGRIQYREWTDQENNKKQVAEIVIDDMIILDSRGAIEAGEQPPSGAGFDEVSFDEGLDDVQLDDVVGIEPADETAVEKKTADKVQEETRAESPVSEEVAQEEENKENLEEDK
jgi:single-strand DNA-binding protein